MITTIKEFTNIFENNDNEDEVPFELIPDYLYHISPIENKNSILNKGILLKTGGTTFLNRTYEPRIYLCTSLIAAYDLSVNFTAHNNKNYLIYEIATTELNKYNFYNDDKFEHGVYTKKPITKYNIINVIDPNFLNYNEEDLEELYNTNWLEYTEPVINENQKYLKSLNVTESNNSKETMTFWHGGNLDDYNDDLSHKSGHWEYGPGLYLSTSYNVVQKYAKGSRKLYQVTVEKGVDLNYNYLPLNIFYDFVNKNVIGSKRKEVLDIINRLQKKDELNAEIFLNIIINNKAITNNKTNILKQFFVNNGIDYNLVDNAFGWGEKMMILFNSKKIVNIKRITSKDIIDEYDLPTKFSNTNI